VIDAHDAYCPIGSAEEMLHAGDPEVLIAGPAGTGKTLACLYKLYIIAAALPGARLLMVRKTRASCTESILVTWETQVVPSGSPILRGAQRMNRHSYRFPNGSEVVVGGMDNSDRIMSTEYDLIYVAEATELSEEDWDKLTTRLGRRTLLAYHQILGDCNPNSPTHWLKQRCDRGACRMVHSTHQDNPLLYADGDWTDVGRSYLDRLSNLAGARRERLLYGRWVAAEGVVYDEWEPATHLVKRFAIPVHWTKVCAIDFGYTNPFVCLWGALDEDKRLYIYRYIYMSRRLVEDHARQIQALTMSEKISAIVADHDAEDAATLKRYGVPCRPARKEIRTGIELVQQRLRRQPDGRPRLFVLEDSLAEVDHDLVEAGDPWTMEQEFDMYIWPTPTPSGVLREVPVDRHNHAMDALRYMVRWCDGARATETKIRPARTTRRRDALRSH